MVLATIKGNNFFKIEEEQKSHLVDSWTIYKVFFHTVDNFIVLGRKKNGKSSNGNPAQQFYCYFYFFCSSERYGIP